MDFLWLACGLAVVACVVAYGLFRTAPALLKGYTEGRTLEETGVARHDLPLLILLLASAYGLCLLQFKTELFLLCGAVVFSTFLIWLSYLDIKQFVLPDFLTFPLLALGIAQSSLPLFSAFQESALGAVFGFGILWFVATTYKLIRKREGMGRGDFKLLAALGSWVGVWQLPLVIFLSAFLGIGIALLRLAILRAPLNSPFPYGPALCAAGFVSLLYGNAILSWYLNLLG